MLARLPDVPVQFDVFELKGGLDQTTPQFRRQPGSAREGQNFEIAVNGGYARIEGYERFDGRPSPTAATYITLVCNITGSLAVGNAVTGSTSAATAVVAAIDGSTVALTKVSGTFVDAENLNVGGTPRASITSTTSASPTNAQRAAYQLAASNIYRADIGVVPGSGSVLGGFLFQGATYAWRNNAGATAAELYRGTSGGWSKVNFLFELSFTVGSGSAPAEGATITKGAVSAVVRRVVTASGDWGAGTAAGRFIIDAPTGGNFTAGAFTAGVTATAGGAQTAITFSPGGRFEHYIGEAGNGVRAYGCDGVNRCFEFDGTTMVPISTAISPDAPSHIRTHKKHLVISFRSSVINSGIGKPYNWTALAGAAEISAGLDITGFLGVPGSDAGGALAIISNSQVAVLYGNSAADWNLVQFSGNGGGRARSMQNMRDGFLFDENGMMSLQAAQEYGNFAPASQQLSIQPFIGSRAGLVADSVVNKNKSQYRLFFSDGYGFYATIVNGEYRGTMPVYFPDPVYCAFSGELSSGVEATRFGSTNGYVYTLDAGTSFDGAAIEAAFSLSFSFQGSYEVRKRFRRLSLELQGDGYAEFMTGYSLDYGSVEGLEQTLQTDAQPSFWDSFTWDSFFWDGRVVAPASMRVTGTGENFSLSVRQSSALWPSYTVNSVVMQFNARRIIRG